MTNNTAQFNLNNSVVFDPNGGCDLIEIGKDGVSVDVYKGLRELRTLRQRYKNPSVLLDFTTVGRNNGNSIVFNVNNNPSYEEYKMRRKAEVLKYRNGANAPGIIVTNSDIFRNVVKNSSAYSVTRLRQIVAQNNATSIPEACLRQNRIWKMSTPSQSGVHDYKTPGYYLDPNITYYPSL